MQNADKYSQLSSIIWPVWLNDWGFVYKLSGCWFECSCSHLNSRFPAWLEQGISWIQATIEYGFTQKRVHDMITTYSQMHHTDNKS